MPRFSTASRIHPPENRPTGVITVPGTSSGV